MKKKYSTAKAFGRSMSPFINEGDKIVIQPVKKKDIKQGDIVVFLQGKKCISHRVMKKKGYKIITKGDNILFLDRELEYSEILGKVIKVYGKYGVINFERQLVWLFQQYLLLRSKILLHIPFIFYKLLASVLRGRRFITEYIAE